MSSYIGEPYTRIRHTNTLAGIDGGPARRHLEHLVGLGMTNHMIARAAGVSSKTVEAVRNAKYNTVTTPVAAALLAVTPRPMHQQVLVLPYPTVRRLNGLAVMGWTGNAIGAFLDVPQTAVSQWRTKRSVAWDTHCRVRDLFDRICCTDGGSEPTKRWAERNRFAHPFDWDDIEDFYESPATPERLSLHQYRAEEVSFLRDQGLSETAIAEKLGLSLYGLQQWERRHGEVAA